MRSASITLARRYPLNLQDSMAVCDANYIRLLKLLPVMGLHSSREIWLHAPGAEVAETPWQRIEMVVIDTQRYTTTLSIRLLADDAPQDHYRPPSMLVRLYHDADTAEVVRYQEQGGLHLCGQPGLRPQFSVDEKQQVNAFLGEWLALCMDRGLGSSPVFADLASTD